MQKISTLQLDEYTNFGREGQCLSVDVVSNKGIVHIDADDGCYLRSDGDFTTMHFEVMGKSEGIEPFIVKIEFEPLPH